MSKTTNYTLAQLAPLLCPEGDEQVVYQTARRFQNWVTAGLLRPVGQAHGGRGVHRHYDRYELGKAAVLVELHRYGLPIRVLELVAGLFDDSRDPDEDRLSAKLRSPTPGQQRQQRKLDRLLQSAWQKRQPVFLTLSHAQTGDLEVLLGNKKASETDAHSKVVVNLTTIFSALSKGDES